MNDRFPLFGPRSTISDIDLDVEEVRLADETRLTRPGPSRSPRRPSRGPADGT